MFSSSFLTILTGLIVLSVFGGAISNSDLKKLCDGNTLNINRLSQAKALVEESRFTREKSCEQYRSSLANLGPILAAVEVGQICKLEFIDQLKQYHVDFVARKSYLIPEALREFFMQLSSEIGSKCMSTLTKNLLDATSNEFKEEDFAPFRGLTKSGSPIFEPANGKLLDLADVLLAKDIERLAAKHHEDTKVLVNADVGENVRQILKSCSLKFRSFYSHLIVPQVKLAKLGYIQKEERNPEEEQLLSKWYGIVQICEIFDVIEVFEDSNHLVNERNSVTSVSDDKAEELRARQESLNKAVLLEGSPVKFSGPEIDVVLSDELPAINQQKLEKSIAKANSKRSRELRTLIKRSLKLKLREALSSGRMRINSLSSLKCSKKEMICSAEVTNVSTETLKDLDDTRVQPRADRVVRAGGALGIGIMAAAALLIAAIFLG